MQQQFGSGRSNNQAIMKEYRDTKMLTGSDEISGTAAAERLMRTSEGIDVINEGLNKVESMNQTFNL